MPRKIHSNKIFAIEAHYNITDKKINSLNPKEILNSKIKMNGIYVPNILNQMKINIYNEQLNNLNFYKLSYNYKSLFDVYMLLRLNKINYSKMKLDKYIHNYLNISNAIGFNELRKKIKVKRKTNYFRIKVKYFNKYSFRFDMFLINQYLAYRWRLKKLLRLIFDKDYRKYFFKIN